MPQRDPSGRPQADMELERPAAPPRRRPNMDRSRDDEPRRNPNEDVERDHGGDEQPIRNE